MMYEIKCLILIHRYVVDFISILFYTIKTNKSLWITSLMDIEKNKKYLYNAILNRLGKKSYKDRTINFSFEQFNKWISKNARYNRIFKEWKAANEDNLLSPSIDRIDNNKNYTLSNIQVLTRYENLLKGKKKVVNPDRIIHLNNRRNEMIFQLDWEGYSNIQIGFLTGLDRTWVYRILKTKPKDWKSTQGEIRLS